jgi:hypothetical protein
VYSVVTISCVLWHFDGQELPKWKLKISMNAFISIFSGFAKSALLLPTAEALGQLKCSQLFSTFLETTLSNHTPRELVPERENDDGF